MIFKHIVILVAMVWCTISCKRERDRQQFDAQLQSLNLTRGEIALCGSEVGGFGTVEFSQSCSEKVKADFNLAIALLHSFEYVEAEKVFAKVIDGDPSCAMAYWGAAMCSFHPLWAPPGKADLEKGSKIIALARSLNDKSVRETKYLEAIATIYDDWDKLDHRTRSLKFEKASEVIYLKYPDDREAAIFYALALRATADPRDKSFQNQKKAGEILNRILAEEPNHPGISHYIIHNYDYPELAEWGLPAARKYASIAAASAHAQHMPSHIFTRLGLWDEAIQSNINSITAAKCYAQSMGIKGHWDEELHGMDYLMYAYLQGAKDNLAKEQLDYLATITEVFPVNFKDAYSMAAIPARYALERKNWTEALALKLAPASFPWGQFPWEKANIDFARLLGAVHMRQIEVAHIELDELKSIQARLQGANEKYKANLVFIQVTTSEAWLKWAQGNKTEALKLMTEAADNEDATEEEPVTPGEVIPARELLGDLCLELNEPLKALEAYEADLVRHPNRFNGIYGAALAAEKSGNIEKARFYFRQLVTISEASDHSRPDEEAKAREFLRRF